MSPLLFYFHNANALASKSKSWRLLEEEQPQSRALGCSSAGGPGAAEGQRDGEPATTGCPAQALRVLLAIQNLVTDN